MQILSSIPSPSDGTLDLWGLELHAYGLMLAIGVIAAAVVADKRATKLGLPEGCINEVATFIVVCGVIGARVYHLFTGYSWDEGGITGALQIWKPGLSIWGAVAGGALGAIFMAKRKRLDTMLLFDAVAPAVALAQGIGRWGNWFNQELFGSPTTLPWGLEIDQAHRPGEYFDKTTFHPTFLYESLFCIALFFFLSWASKHFSFKRGQTISLYVALYCTERLGMEFLRVDKASQVGGLRFNGILALVLAICGYIAFLKIGRRALSEDAVTDRAEEITETEQ